MTVMLLSRCTCRTWSKATKEWPKREFSRSQRERKTEGRQFEVEFPHFYCNFLCIRILLSIAVVCRAYCFLLQVLFMVLRMLQFLIFLNQNRLAPIYVQVKPFSEFRVHELHLSLMGYRKLSQTQAKRKK